VLLLDCTASDAIADEVPGLLGYLKQHRAGLHGGRIWRHRLKSGEIIHVDSSIHHLPFGGRPAALAVVRDITSQLRATEALASSEARWERLFAASGTGIAEDAGPLIDQVIDALLGWRPAVGMRRLTLEPMPEAGYSGGFAYYPLVWSSVLQRAGAAHATPGVDN
jgi:PAS domain-containing protein